MGKNKSLTYARGNGRSYFRDLAEVTLRGTPLDLGDSGAEKRLKRHAKDVQGAAFSAIADLDINEDPVRVPPLYLLNIPEREHWLGTVPLPRGTDSITMFDERRGLPITAKVEAFGYSVGAAVRLLGQTRSWEGFDEVIYGDLAQGLRCELHRQVFAGSGGITGLGKTPHIHSLRAEDDGEALVRAIGEAIAKIHTTRLDSPEVIVMHPRRWSWCIAAGVAGPEPRMLGLPVEFDQMLPQNLGPTRDEEPIYVLRRSDLCLFKSPMRVTVSMTPSIKRDSVLYRARSSAAFTAERMPEGICEIRMEAWPALESGLVGTRPHENLAARIGIRRAELFKEWGHCVPKLGD